MLTSKPTTHDSQAGSPKGQQTTGRGLAAGTTVPLEKLRRGSVTGVPHANKEDFVSVEEFQEAFGVDKAVYSALPGWKKQATIKKGGQEEGRLILEWRVGEGE